MAVKSKKLAALTVRVDADIQKQFHKICVQSDLSQSQVIRRLMRRWIEEHKQMDIFKG